MVAQSLYIFFYIKDLTRTSLLLYRAVVIWSYLMLASDEVYMHVYSVGQ